jgi:hypothetical protein
MEEELALGLVQRVLFGKVKEIKKKRTLKTFNIGWKF